MATRKTQPKEMARKLVRILRSQRPDYYYLKKVFQHTRELLKITPGKAEKRLPELLTDDELVAFTKRSGNRATLSTW
jgi:integrase/recombinase XerD